jgi:hypothetical protein
MLCVVFVSGFFLSGFSFLQADAIKNGFIDAKFSVGPLYYTDGGALNVLIHFL